MQLIHESYMILAIMFGMLMFYVIGTITNMVVGLYKRYKFLKNMEKKYEIELKKVEDFKKNGGIHKWVQNVAVRLPNGKIENTHVCEHTGYCPSVEAFIPVSRIKQIVETRKIEEEYKEYKNQEIIRLTQQYKLPCNEVTRKLVEEILSMKRNFHIKKIEDYKNKL